MVGWTRVLSIVYHYVHNSVYNLKYSPGRCVTGWSFSLPEEQHQTEYRQLTFWPETWRSPHKVEPVVNKTEIGFILMKHEREH